MAERKKNSSRHKTIRVSMQIPLEWVKVLRKLRAQTHTPLTWIVLDLIKREAQARGIDTPTPPWEKTAEPDEPDDDDKC